MPTLLIEKKLYCSTCCGGLQSGLRISPTLLLQIGLAFLNHTPNLREVFTIKVFNSQEKKPESASSVGREYDAYFIVPKSEDKSLFCLEEWENRKDGSEHFSQKIPCHESWGMESKGVPLCLEPNSLTHKRMAMNIIDGRDKWTGYV